MSGPRISVVMSVYNGMPFLEHSIESILSQRAATLEFLVVDDGSTDGSEEVLQRWSRLDARMRVITNHENQGVALSRNAALRLAQGVYVACQDADDVSLPDRLSRQASYLDAHPDVGMVGTQVAFIWDVSPTGEGPHSKFPVSDEELQLQLLESNCFCAGSVMIRRTELDKVGLYDQTLAPSEDYDLWLRLAEVTKIANLSDLLYVYRQHDGSASSRSRCLQMHRKALALERAMVRREGEPLSLAARRAVARDLLRAACIGAASGEIEEARLSAQRALQILDGMRDPAVLIRDVVLRYADGHWGSEARRHVGTLFDQVLPPGKVAKEARRRVLSRLYLGEIFDGAPAPVDRRLITAVRDNPRTLLNRGVWSIGLKHLVLRRPVDD